MASLAPALLALLVVPVAAAAPPTAPDAALVSAQLRIDVDAQGRVAAVAPTAPLPAPVVDAIRRHAATWTFVPPRRDGTPVGGTTYARVAVCAAPAADGDGIAFSMGPAFNGPGVDARMLQRTFFPPISRELADLGRFEMDVVYDVAADGRAALVSLATVPARPHLRREIETAYRKWLAPMRFEPERIDGVPVATRMRMPITFTFERVKRIASNADLRRHEVARSAACQALLAGQSEQVRPQVAVDSPFRLQPSG